MNTVMLGLKPAKGVVILKSVGQQKTKSGIVIPDAPNKPETGLVVAVGRENSLSKDGSGIMPVDFSVGDQIVYRKYADNKIDIMGEQYNFIRFEDVLAVVDKQS